MTPRLITQFEGLPYWGETFRLTNPEFNYVAADPIAVVSDFPWLAEVFATRPAYDQQNLARYLYAFRDGGVIVDGNVECLSKFDQLVDANCIVLGTANGRDVLNSVIVTPAREELWLLMISFLIDDAGATLQKAVDAYENKYKEDYVQNRITRIRVKLGDFKDSRARSRVNRLEPHHFYPINPVDPIHEHFIKVSPDAPLDRETACRLFPSSFAVSYWG